MGKAQRSWVTILAHATIGEKTTRSRRLHLIPVPFIAAAFQRVVQEVDRFPSPAHIVRAARELYEEDYRLKLDNEFKTKYGFLDVVRYDEQGIECRIDSSGVKHYKAKDCAEGREFLRRLAEVAGKVTTPPPLPHEDPKDAIPEWEQEDQ